MSGFGGFGATPITGGLFGAKPPESSFSTTGTTTAAPTFGTLNFGTSAPTFGTPGNVAPAFGTLGTTAPAFGTTGAAAPTFGTPGAAVPAFKTPGATAPTFGATGLFGTTSASGVTTGTATTAATGFTFGAAATTSATGFTLGAPATSLSTFSSANTTNNQTFGTMNFSLQKTTAGFLPTPSTSTVTTCLSFTSGTSIATTTSAAYGIGQTTTAQTLGFTFNQPGSSSLPISGQKTAGGLTFGTPSTTSASAFKFMTPNTTTTTATTTPGFSLGKPDDTSLGKTPGTPGLGGVDKSQLNQGLSGAGTAEPNQVKDNILPDQILQTLNDFQNFTKQQKSVSVEISHGSSKPLKKVQEDTDVMESLLAMITSGLTRNALAVDKLKTETAQGLHQAEMAQRNHESPPGLEYDSTAPAEYFNDLVTKFETDTMRLRVQIEASEKHLRSLTQSTSISPQELTLAMRRLHETLVVLAARVQTLHTTVQSQKEQYRNLRRVYLKDDSTVFDKEKDYLHGRKQTIFTLHSLTGPTPFSETSGSGRPLSVDGLAMLNDTTVTPIISTAANRGWITPLSASTGTCAVLSPTNTLQTSQQCDTTGFQLSKPPTGNKRNKR